MISALTEDSKNDAKGSAMINMKQINDAFRTRKLNGKLRSSATKAVLDKINPEIVASDRDFGKLE
jgi:hypothetical protein